MNEHANKDLASACSAWQGAETSDPLHCAEQRGC